MFLQSAAMFVCYLIIHISLSTKLRFLLKKAHKLQYNQTETWNKFSNTANAIVYKSYEFD